MDTTRPTGAGPRAAGTLPTAGAAPWRATAALAALLVLAGCSGSPTDGQPADATPSVTASASAVPTPDPSVAESASSTLTPEEQQAFEEATATVLAYRQTIADLYSGARTNLNDLDKVATGDLLDRGLRNIQQGLGQGYRSEPQGVTLVLVSAEPVSVDLEASPATIVVRACIDATALTDVSPDGTRTPGLREESTYHLTQVPTGSGSAWAVERETMASDLEARQC